ncbi:hypothetical protein NQ317_016179 [Molorchus minor]|uniref:Uncharacterized protein n=1 Tax=Molorchus minor TaxID=1323400 RepID=A0ABQ9J9V6_9CUCU|nr:hypothetical protein NQ317_016179 [Molorchus minor]
MEYRDFFDVSPNSHLTSSEERFLRFPYISGEDAWTRGAKTLIIIGLNPEISAHNQPYSLGSCATNAPRFYATKIFYYSY